MQFEIRDCDKRNTFYLNKDLPFSVPIRFIHWNSTFTLYTPHTGLQGLLCFDHFLSRISRLNPTSRRTFPTVHFLDVKFFPFLFTFFSFLFTIFSCNHFFCPVLCIFTLFSPALTPTSEMILS